MLGESIGYKSAVKSAVLDALREGMGGTFPSPSAGVGGINIGIEYPQKQGSYPAIWVEFEEQKLESMNLGYEEAAGTTATQVSRWLFAGNLKFHFFSLRAKERDEISDAFVKVVGFDTDFKDALAENPYIGIMVNVQKILPFADSTSPGTPWGSDEYVYYSSYGLVVQGEFFTDIKASGIIERVQTYPRLEGEPNLPDDSQGQFA